MRYLGLDLGTKSLGVSVSDFSNTFAMPYQTLHFPENEYESVIDALEKIVKEKKITDFVLGLPKNMDNSCGFAAQRSQDFAELLKQKFCLPVHFVDERLTTKEAERILLQADKSRKKRKKVIDNVASSLILETFLKERIEHERK
ncbi:TPA: Holliday junction resolvase RuvX [Candidatus Ventrenecus avicola]|nr:Holliday junction resolvase RuvX [Candidatus Ventrenecus avicola]